MSVNSKKLVFIHPTANANVRAALKALNNAGLLVRFYTTIACFRKSWLDYLGSIRLFSEVRRRSFSSSLKPHTKTFSWLEVCRLVSTKAGFQKLIKHETGLCCIDAIYKNLDKRVSLHLKKVVKLEVKGVYAYEDGAAFSFKAAKKINLQCFYDLPIGYWRTARLILKNEIAKWPDWSETLTGFLDSEEKLARKDEELRLADRIFVASKFTAKTLENFPGHLAPVEVIPYGFPEVFNERRYKAVSKLHPLKILFVGSLSQRKGIAYLFSAVETFKQNVELTLAGRKIINDCRPLNLSLSRYRWFSSLPYAEVIKLMREHDILIFPSLFEGFGLVITEAMSQGTPVITTERTAGPDIITHGQNGWLVKAGSTEALQKAIEDILYHPNIIPEVGKEAIATARCRPWHVYGQELAEAMQKHLNKLA